VAVEKKSIPTPALTGSGSKGQVISISALRHPLDKKSDTTV